MAAVMRLLAIAVDVVPRTLPFSAAWKMGDEVLKVVVSFFCSRVISAARKSATATWTFRRKA